MAESIHRDSGVCLKTSVLAFAARTATDSTTRYRMGEAGQWVGCGECDLDFKCCNGMERCIRQPISPPSAIGDTKAVPLEPTNAMIRAGKEAFQFAAHGGYEDAWKKAYSAMLAAAPAEATRAAREEEIILKHCGTNAPPPEARTNSPTPRCDDFFGADDYRGAREFARQLERENSSLKMAVQEPAAWNHHCLVCQDPAGCAARRACDRNSDKLDKCDDGRSCANATTGCWLREDGSGGCIKRLPPNDVLTYSRRKQ
jgi:hypothetical protein